MARGDPPLPRRHRLPLRRLDRPRAGGRALRTVPARGFAAAAAPRLARARAVSTVNRRGRYGSPSPRSAPRRIAADLPVAASGRTGRDPLGYVQKPCSARRVPASMGVWPSARAKCVSAPEGTAARRCRLHVPCVAGTGVPRREVRAGAGHRFTGEETAPLQVDRKTRRNPVHAVPSVGCRGWRIALRVPAGKSEHRADPHQVLVAVQILLQVAVQDIGHLTDLRL
jgi:hypothetical protein